MSPAPALAALAGEPFLSLTTFRRSGEAVSTPVWAALLDDALVVRTTSTTGKVKRLRRDPRVQVSPCDRRGQVRADTPVVDVHADVHADPATLASAGVALARKYGLQYRLASLVLRLPLPRRRRDRGEMVILRLTA